MSDSLLDILLAEASDKAGSTQEDVAASRLSEKYLSRLLSLRPSDLTTTEPQALSQASQTNLLSIQALSSRSQRSTIASSDHLSSLQSQLPTLQSTATSLKSTIPSLDEAALTFATTYSRNARQQDASSNTSENALAQRKQSTLFHNNSSTLQDIRDLPNLLRTAIASAASSSAGSANYTQALDLLAHIKRLRILYPDSKLIISVQQEADNAMVEMTKSLLANLRGQNLRLAAAIRTIGWIRRIVPRTGSTTIVGKEIETQTHPSFSSSTTTLSNHDEQSEGTLGALFLISRLHTFLSMTEDALAPLRDLADQETEKRLQHQSQATGKKPAPTTAHSSAIHGQQTERYLKRYIEIFREQSFATLQMYRGVFPQSVADYDGDQQRQQRQGRSGKLPSALASFPLHLVSLLMETLQTYLPNVTDAAARESLLIQVLYAANSLGRLGADFSMLISLLDLPANEGEDEEEGEKEKQEGEEQREPEWYRIIQKHKVQAARLDALASGQERRVSQEVVVK